MKKETKIGVIVVTLIVVVAIIVGFFLLGKKDNKSQLDPVNSVEDLSSLVEKVYGDKKPLPSLNTTVIDVTNKDQVSYATGLENGNDLQYAVVSEPMMGSQAYSFILVKVKDGVDANLVAKEMLDKVNTAKWICVSAEKVYATNSGDVAMLIMSSEEWAKPVYDSFKSLAVNTGKEYERAGQ